MYFIQILFVLRMHAPHICIFAPTTAEWEDNEEYVDNAAQEQRGKKSIKCVTVCQIPKCQTNDVHGLYQHVDKLTRRYIPFVVALIGFSSYIYIHLTTCIGCKQHIVHQEYGR